MSCKIILWCTLKCVLLLIAQLSNYFCAHYSEKWQYWKERKNVHSFFPHVAPTDIHENTNVWSRAWWKLGPIYETFPRLQKMIPKDKQCLLHHIRLFALRHTIFTVKFKNLIHSTWKQVHSQEYVCLYFIHHHPGWFQLLISSASFESSPQHTGIVLKRPEQP